MIRNNQLLFVVLATALIGISQAAPKDVFRVNTFLGKNEAPEPTVQDLGLLKPLSIASDVEKVKINLIKEALVSVDDAIIEPAAGVTIQVLNSDLVVNITKAVTSTPLVEKVVDTVEKLPTTDVLKAFLNEASSQIYTIFNELSHIIVDVDHHVDFSSSLTEKLKVAAEQLKALSFTAKKFLALDDAVLGLEIKFALQKIRRSGDVFILGEDAASLGINLNALKNMATDKDIAPFEADDSEEKAFDPDIISIIEYSYDPEQVKYYWKAWHDKNSQYAAENLFEVVDLFQKAAKNLELPVLEFWYENYNKEFLGEMEEVMEQLKPFYLQLHAYVRWQLFRNYGAGVIKPDGPIPEHLFDEVVLRNWKSDEMSSSLVSNDYLPNLDSRISINDAYNSAEKLLKKVENFYTSIGLEPLPEKFWETNIVKKSENEDKTVCTPTINDITPDVVLQYCDKVDFKTLMQDYALIGRMHFALEKKDLPAYFFSGYNLKYPIAEAIILSASNHLEDFLNDEYDEMEKYTEDMYLLRNFRMAINTMFKIPRYYVHTIIMTKLLEGTIERSDLNKFYWTLMEEHAGIEPPIDRDDDSLDLPYNFYTDLNQNNDVTSKFTSEILGYQFYRALCQKAGYMGELHMCDFHGKKEVGNSLKEIVSLGSSKPWREVIGVLLPENSKLTPSALLEYYTPVRTALKKYNTTHNLKTGWEFSDKALSKKIYLDEETAIAFVKRAEGVINELYGKMAAEAFSKNLDINEYENFWKESDTAVAASKLTEISLEAKKYYHNRFANGDLTKALNKLSKIADVFVLADKVEDLLFNRNRLLKLATDVDIERYQHKDDDDLIAFYPDIQEVFKNSSDEKELLYYWEAWRERNAGYAKNLFFNMLDDFSAAADKLDISTTQFWFKQYSSDFLEQMGKVITDLKPFYSMLHGYIREKLNGRYSDVRYSDPIPDHLYHQVLLQVWTNNSILEEDLPFSELPPSDKFISEHKYNALNLLEEADKFYQSLGFDALDEDFWKNRVQPATEGAPGDCHATIYDWTPTVYVKYCEKVDFKKFMQAHGYMGRVHYAHEKRNVPSYYFNSYLLEYPVGEAVILSASSPKHMKNIGLSGDFDFTEKVRINRLMRMATHTLFNLHMYFVRVKVVTDYLSGDVKKEDITKHYWTLMIKYAGVEPPKDRSDADFDFPYEFYTDLEQNHQLKKFVSEVLGYQFYESLCGKHNDDLSNCDFYGDKEVGAQLLKMFQLGGTKSWQSTIKVLLPDSPKLSASGILNYYKPLEKWLEVKNEELTAVVRFGTTDKKFYRMEEFITEEIDD